MNLTGKGTFKKGNQARLKPVKWIREGDCFRCISHRLIDGYPYIQRNFRNTKISRFILLRRGVDPSLLACHTCDNRWCIRPDHIFAGTNADNSRDMVHKGRSLIGEKQPTSRLKSADVLEIRHSKETAVSLAGKFLVHPTLIRLIRRRKRWKHL